MMNRSVKRAGQAVLDLLYPLRCPMCQKVPARGFLWCPDCRESLPLITGPRCLKCGKTVWDFGELCDDCRTSHHRFDEGVGLCLYDEQMRTILSAFKYKGRKVYGEPLGLLLAEEGAVYIKKWQISAVVPVPIHRSRFRTRGYNQAAVLAKAAAERWQMPVLEDAVVRQKETRAMKMLGREARLQNLQGAFREGTTSVRGLNVLIVDDIYTTGATVDVMTEVLKNAGARAVYFLSICIGGGFMVEY